MRELSAFEKDLPVTQDSQFRNWLLCLLSKIHMCTYNYEKFLNRDLNFEKVTEKLIQYLILL